MLSLTVVYLVSAPVTWLLTRIAGRCACVTAEPGLSVNASGMAAAMPTRTAAVVADEAACADQPTVVAIPASRAVSLVHWLSSGMVGFARGWNDAPKIAALGLVALTGPSGMAVSFAIVTVAMAIGGLVAGARVLETLAKKLTEMPLSGALTASMATATLVSLASWHGLPVSTTHVSTGAVIGLGLRNDPRAVRWRVVGEILLSWVLTLPFAALVAAGVKWLLP